MEIFMSTAGTVAVIASDKAVPGRITVKGFPPAGSGQSSVLISGVEYRQNTNQQFQSSLDGSVYVYVFGDRMGEINVSGIAFKGLCKAGEQNGMGALLEYYKTSRASANPNPIIVNAAGQTIAGFLVSIVVKDNVLANEPMAAVSDFTLGISALPSK